MIKPFIRRWPYIVMVLSVAFSSVLATHWSMNALQERGYFTGWLILGSIVVLIILNLRKKITVLSLGSVFEWTQIHLYVGWLSLFLFFLHLSWSLPNGLLEISMAVLYLGVVLSGVVGSYLYHALPKRLSRRGEEVLFERIPKFRRVLMMQAEALMNQAVEESQSTTLMDFYILRLHPFFCKPHHYFQHLMDSNHSRFQLFNELQGMERYLDHREQLILKKLIKLVERKDDLDYHHALQGTLRYWLFVHIPLSYGLLVLILVHVATVFGFRGGVL